MALASGTRLGPYEIEAPLGAGGMGEVYCARDPRLGRNVALKILPESFSRDSDRLRRFQQETQAIAALNHPNILAIHDVGQHNGTPFLVSELLHGESLREALGRGALPQRKAIEYAVQIAQGLAAAHEKDIVHRDLKPENLFITRDGRVKILDFGLAKLAAKGADSATLTSAHTSAGTVMGTASYMAPEQVRGEAADPRTDIFAFGVVMYEMLSGQRAFRRDTPAETMTAVLREEPPEFSHAHPLSPALDKIVRRCLEKDPHQRFQSARDLSFALSALSGSDTSAARVVPAPRRVLPLVLAAAVMVVVAAIALPLWFASRHSAQAGSQQFAIPLPGEVSHLALSADGSTLAFVSPDPDSALPVLYVQRVGSPEARLVESSEGASYPFLSPDGSAVAFFAKGKLQKVSTSGGTPQVLAPVLAARGGSWGRKGVILYTPDSGNEIWRVNEDGSGSAPVTREVRVEKQVTHRWAQFLPDGEHFLFWAGDFTNRPNDTVSGIYASSLDDNKRAGLVLLCHSNFAYSSGYLFFVDDDRHLVSIPFDPSTAHVTGSPAIVTAAIGFQPSTFYASIAASENGTLIYNSRAGAALSSLTWADRKGKDLGRLGEPAVMFNPTISPDGRRVAMDISDPKANNVDVWIAGAGGNTRFTYDPAEEVVGVWSRDGSRIAYRANVPAGTAVLMKAASGLERERTIVTGPTEDDIFPNSWTPDDRQIVCTYQSPAGSRLRLVQVSGDGSLPLLSGKGNQTNGQISRDGKWLAYASDESGQWEVYVTTFPGAVGQWQVSRGGGTEPRWRADGKEIYYLGPGGMLNAVSVSTEGTFATGMPLPLFQFHGRAPISSTDTFSYDVSADGSRFLVNRYLKPDHVEPLTIVLHAAGGPQH
jgi:serine/threonine protein kinase